MQLLQCGAQSYAWGKKESTSMVAKLQKGHEDSATATKALDGGEGEEKRFAELWIGVHNSLPSKIVSEGSHSSPALLKDFLAENATTYLGEKHIAFYEKMLADAAEEEKSAAAAIINPKSIPFLLKVLSIDMALSIQAHPTRALAKVLHARDKKNYPDPNHKPELIVALTPFEALCCFRPISEIVFFLNQSPYFKEMIGDEAAKALVAAEAVERRNAEEKAQKQTTKSGGDDVVVATSEEAKAALQQALHHMYAVDKATLEAAVAGQVGLIEKDEAFGHSAHSLNAVHSVFVRTNKLFPGDVGLWMMYFLNYLQLQPGDALFLGASEPHAYISGDGVEIMANSDNVVRAGLTPKFKDVETLLSMLTYDTNALRSSRYSINTTAAVQEYAPPSWCDDFSLFAVRLSREKGTTTATVDLPSVGLGVCVGGKAVVRSGGAPDKTSVGFGSDFLLPVGRVTFDLEDGVDSCTVFVGTTNVHGALKGSRL